MSFHSWLRNLRSALMPRRDQRDDKRQGSVGAATYRPSIEVLEDRLTPSLSFGGDWYPYQFVWAPSPPLSADFTSDGIIDQLTTGSGGLIVLPGRGDGTFGDPISTYTNAGGVLAAAEFNGDGRLDLVTAQSDWEGTAAFVDVLLGRGDGTFLWVESHYIWGLGFPTEIGIAQGGQAVMVAGYDQYQGEYVYAALSNDGNWPPIPRSLRIGDVTIAEGNSGSVAATFTVTLSPGSTEPVTVTYATGNGTATSNDYQAASGTLTFAPGETEKTITVLVNGDRLGEPNETFVVNLSNPTNATISDGQGVGTILDDEPRISISDVTKAEGRKGQTTVFTFTVTLSAAYDQPVTMSFRTANGTATAGNNDYVAKSGTLTFAPGETTKTITIEVKGDSKREGNETFYLDLFDNSSNSLATKKRGVGTILNDD